MTNTRPRDFYDVHVLWRTKGSECDLATLSKAITATCDKRESSAMMAQWELVLDEVAADQAMLALWAKYVKKNPYAEGIELPECCQTAKAILSPLDF
ncbi:MAG: nucleotidyl transferase AbiEii/AbiGii toxin family protein [Coriobacteriia bacterium]|nr:nucleotidyl transferase AbiEii/AbiGii toxin family protein [Coriobacteriia bacterium]